MHVFDLFSPKNWTTPIIVSTPHVGTELPFDIKDRMTPIASNLPDTDWFVDRLYDFVPDMGAVLLRARYSRYVIDLNRPYAGESLYKDSRRQTEVIPSTTFEGENIYSDGYRVNDEEFSRRVDLFYKPYYAELQRLIQEGLTRFGKILLWDGHSITRVVRSIQKEAFVDLMLGDRDGHTSHPKLVEIAQKRLIESPYSFAYNAPFKGGQITRFHGQSEPGVYAMQLEMSQDIYMSDGQFDEAKANDLRGVLKSTLQGLAEGMESL